MVNEGNIVQSVEAMGPPLLRASTESIGVRVYDPGCCFCCWLVGFVVVCVFFSGWVIWRMTKFEVFIWF